MRSVQDTVLYQEIHQQADVIDRLLTNQSIPLSAVVKAVQARSIHFVMIAARGTSDNAARYANYLLGAVNRMPVALAAPSLFSIYQAPPRLDHCLVIGISQSGKSPDIVGVLEEADRQGALTVAITNFPDSDLGQAAEHVIDLGADAERSIAATKTYTAQLAVIAALSAKLSGNTRMLQTLNRIPKQIERTLKMSKGIGEAAERYRYMRECVVIGRGYNYCTAFELALKLKELTYTIVEPYSSADFLHGPLAMLEPGFPGIVIAPRGAMLAELIDFIATLRKYQAEVIVISEDSAALEMARVPLAVPVRVPEWISPLIQIIPGQLLAMHLAFLRGYDPDHPRSLKKVTETR